MGKILDVAESHLRQAEWIFERMQGRDAIRCSVRAKNASFRLYLDAIESHEQFLVYAVSPNPIPEARRPAAAEYVTRANYGMRIGNFEMDLNDGEIRYKVSADVEGSSLTPRMVENMIATAVTTLDRYFPGLMGICFADQNPLEAIERIEKPQRTGAAPSASPAPSPAP